MNEKVKPNLLLETDDKLYLLFDELIILGNSYLAFAELGTSATDIVGLLRGSRKKDVIPASGQNTHRERTYGGCGEPGELKFLSLNLLASSE